MTRILAGAVLVLCVGIWPGSPQVTRAQESATEDDDTPAAPAEKADKPESKSESPAEKSEPAKEPADKSDEKATDEKATGEKASDEKSADDEEKPASKPTEKRDDARPSPGVGPGRGRRDFRSGPERGSADDKSVIADFTAAGAPAGSNRKPGQKPLSFKFVKAPWTQVLEKFAKEADLTLDMDEPPTGSFTYIDDRMFTATEALDLINGYLLKRGYLLIRRDKFLVVWNFDSPVPPNLVPVVNLSELDKLGRYDYVTVLIPVKQSVEAKTVADEVSGNLLSPQGKIQTLVKSNQLKVTDIADNIRLIKEFVDAFDHAPPGKEMTFRDFELVHISASEAERMLRDQFGLPSRNGQAKGANETTAAPRSQNNNNGRGGGFDWRTMMFGGGRGGIPGMGGGGFPGMGGGGFPGMGGGGAPPGGGDSSSRGDDGGRGGRRGRDRDRGDRGGRDRDRGGDGNSESDEGLQFKILMTADTRGNRLLVTASVDDMHLVEIAVKAIDVKHDPSERLAARTARDPYLHVYAVETADLDVAVDVLNMMVPGIVIHDDTKTHRLNIYASPNEHKEVAKIIKEIDAGAGDLVAVVQLNRLPPTAAAASLRSLFATNNKGGDPPTIEADETGRRLMMRGAPEQISQIKKLLTDMGELGRGGNGMRRGPLAVITPQGRSTEDIVSLLERALPRRENQFIRIVTPDEFGKPARRPSLFDRRDDSSQIDRPDSRSRATRAPATGGGRFERSVNLPSGVPADDFRREILDRIRNIDEERPSRNADPKGEPDAGPAEREPANENPPCEEAAAKDKDDEDAADKTATKKPAAVEEEPTPKTPVASEKPAAESRRETAKPSADVQITVDGDRILIYCEDEDELNRIEALIENLASAPARTKWTVYPLKTPDSAESTATMLGTLFPEGNVTKTQQPTTGGGLFSLFNQRNTPDPSLNNNLSKSGTLKIIPEVRSNSLYITGPEDSVAQALEAIKFLDNSESLADRKPNRIQLKHARVMEVADHLFDLFREEMGFPMQQNRGGFGGGGFGGFGGGNPFGGGFNPLGGGGNNQQNQRQARVQLNIAPDTRTNTLWVFANDTMFEKVESTVRWIDDTVHESKPTVKVYSMSKTNSAVVQQTLAALVEGVHTTTTSTGLANNAGPGQRGQQQQPFGQGFGNRFGGQQGGFGGQGFGGFGQGGFGGPGGFGGGQGFGGQGFGGQGFGGGGFGGRGGFGGQGFGGQGFGGQGFGGQGFGGRGGQGFGGQGGGQGFGGGGRGGGGGGRGGR